jgi:hypothetical protein
VNGHPIYIEGGQFVLQIETAVLRLISPSAPSDPPFQILLNGVNFVIPPTTVLIAFDFADMKFGEKWLDLQI